MEVSFDRKLSYGKLPSASENPSTIVQNSASLSVDGSASTARTTCDGPTTAAASATHSNGIAQAVRRDRYRTSGPSGEFAGFRVHADLLAFLDEQRHANRHPGLERGQLGHAAARRVAARPRLG